MNFHNVSGDGYLRNPTKGIERSIIRRGGKRDSEHEGTLQRELKEKLLEEVYGLQIFFAEPYKGN